MTTTLSRRQFTTAVAVIALAGVSQVTPARAHQKRKAAMVEAVRRAHLMRRHSYAAGLADIRRERELWLLTAYERFSGAGLTRLEARNVCHAGYSMAKRDYRTPRDPFGPFQAA